MICLLTFDSEQVVAYALSRRPNVKLVDTELPFGKEGFTSYMGKNFDPSLKLTRRYYPHTYNVDGFFVAKFQKTGPTVATPRNGDSKQNNFMLRDHDEAPSVHDTPGSNAADSVDSVGDFANFDEDEDRVYMDRAKKSAMRRRGIDPRSLRRK